MSTIETQRPEGPSSIDPYLAAVALALAGVPDAERLELLDDLADHLAELAADHEGGDAAGDLADRLGAPEAYAAEFVASAGIDVPEPTPPRPPSLGGWIAGLTTDLDRSAAVRAVRGFLPDLRPGWWVLRAWAALAILAGVADGGRSVFPLPDPVGNAFVALLALAAAVVGSVHLGRQRGWPDRALNGVGAVGVLVAVLAGGAHTEYVYQDGGPSGFGALTGPNGEHIANIWPYDGEGNPIDGVFLFDQDGNPIGVGQQNTSGVVVPGLFPQSQTTYEYDPVTGAERQVPTAPPLVRIPQLPGATSTTDSTATTSTTSTTEAPDPAATADAPAPTEATLPPETDVPG